MDLPEDLLEHAIELLSLKDDRMPTELHLRRAVSATYYALFHKINECAVALLAPNVSPQTNHRIQRWFDHLEMKKVAVRFMKSELDQPLLALIGPVSSQDMQKVARSFVSLQEARHAADYDLSYTLTADAAVNFLREGIDALDAWLNLQATAEANIFMLSLLLWKNWEKDRS